MFFCILMCTALILFLLSMEKWKSTVGSGFSPTMLYAAVWGGIWFIHWAGLMYYRPVREYTLLLSAIPLIAIFVSERLALSDSSRVVVASWDFRPDSLWNSAIWCGATSFLAGFVILISSWLVFGNVLSHANDLKLARVTTGTGMYSGTPLALPAKYASLLYGASYPAIVFGVFYLRLINRKAWIGLALPVGGAVMFDLGWGSRSHTYDALLLLALLLFLVPSPTPKKRQAAAGPRPNRRSTPSRLVIVCVFAACVFALTLIGNRTREQESLEVGDRYMPLMIVQFIDYNVGTLVCFDGAIDQTTDRTWGRMSFWGFEQWLRLLRIIPPSIGVPPQLVAWEKQYIPIQPDGHWHRSGNVFTWLRYLYSDFGVIGLAVLPFLLSCLATRFALVSMRRSWGMASLAGLTLCYLQILRSPGIVLLRYESFVLAALLTCYASKRIVRQAVPDRRSSPAFPRQRPTSD